MLMKRNSILVLSVFVYFLAVSGSHAQQVSDMILHNGKIITVDDHSFSSELGTIAQAMHVQNGKILHIGGNQQIRAMAGPSTKVIDLKGRTVIPGFILTHEHPYDWGSVDINALKKYLTDDEVIVRVLDQGPQEDTKAFPGVLKDAVAKAKPGQWIYIVITSGKNFEFQSMSNGGMGRALVDPSVTVQRSLQITKEQLDEWAPNNPVYAGGWLSEDGLSGDGLNQRAIDEAVKAMPDPAMNPLAPGDQSIRSSSPAASPRRWIFSEVIMKDNYPDLVNIMKSSMDWWAGYGMTAFASNAIPPRICEFIVNWMPAMKCPCATCGLGTGTRSTSTPIPFS